MFWRPVVFGTLSYTEARGMHEEELIEANIAIDMFSPHIERGES